MGIEVKGISKTFKNQVVLKDISLSLMTGKCYGFIGNNGCGKSILLKSICGFIKVDSGEIWVNDKQIIGGSHFIESAGIIIESPEWMNNLSGYANLCILAEIRKQIDTNQINGTLKLVGLEDSKDKKVKKYSLGMKQRLRIAQAIMENPDILILDEPFNGLDKSGVQEIQDLLATYKSRGKTILLTSHDERNIEFLCDEVYELESGAII